MKIYLNITDTSGKKRVFPVTELHTTIGRSKKSKIQISDDLCSGLHCKAYLENDCIFVEDADSKNGVFLNEIKVKKQRIYVGDIVRIGNSKMSIEHTKMSNDDIQKHTSKHANRKDGSITLELETFQETKKKNESHTKKQKEYVKSAKLYEGVAADSDKNRKATRKLILLEKIAFIIDSALTIGFLLGPFIYKASQEKEFLKTLIKDPSQIVVGDNLFYLVGSVLIAGFFFKWNRSREKGTIGETILRI